MKIGEILSITFNGPHTTCFLPVLATVVRGPHSQRRDASITKDVYGSVELEVEHHSCIQHFWLLMSL